MADSTDTSGETLSASARQRHREACRAGDLGYEDPDTGLFVLTSVYLKQQGSCCGGGCRHCPWPDDEQARAGRPPDAPAWPYLPDSGDTR
jgi:hypothetical protein